MEWTAERIAGLMLDQVKTLRENAAKAGAQRTVDLCDAEQVRRRVFRAKSTCSYKPTHIGETVHGFHFACPTEKGITRNPDGTIWTGTWVVDKRHAERAVKIGGYVASHVSKSEPSYLQGIVRDWRIQGREPTSPQGQHIKLGIAESNLFLLLAALGLSGPLFGTRLLPIGTLYDPSSSAGTMR